jgi:hypothetical protein
MVLHLNSPIDISKSKVERSCSVLLLPESLEASFSSSEASRSIDSSSMMTVHSTRTFFPTHQPEQLIFRRQTSRSGGVRRAGRGARRIERTVRAGATGVDGLWRKGGDERREVCCWVHEEEWKVRRVDVGGEKKVGRCCARRGGTRPVGLIVRLSHRFLGELFGWRKGQFKLCTFQMKKIRRFYGSKASKTHAPRPAWDPSAHS